MDSNIWHTYTLLPCRPWECASIDHACAVPSKSLKIKPRNVHLTVMLVNMQDTPGSPQDQITVHTKMNIKTSSRLAPDSSCTVFAVWPHHVTSPTNQFKDRCQMIWVSTGADEGCNFLLRRALTSLNWIVDGWVSSPLATLCQAFILQSCEPFLGALHGLLGELSGAETWK